MSNPPTLRGVSGPEIFAARLACLESRCGEKGWDSYDGDPVSPEALSLARATAESLARFGLPWPFLYPANDGGTQLDWDAGPWAISLEIKPDGQVLIDATDCGPGGQSHDAEATIDAAADALVGVLRLAGITWGGA